MAGIYIHIPFCKQACHYCDFHFSTSLKNKSLLVDALITEIAQRAGFFDENEHIETIYFGGGTPTLLTNIEFDSIINAIHKKFRISSNIEFTVEANPDDINVAKLGELKTLGVNRLSIGIQSFNDQYLKVMNRSHNAAHALNCIRLAQDNFFANLSIDLMYGLSNQSAINWQDDLAIVEQLNIQHLSCYSLTVEERTALHKFIKDGKINRIDDGIANDQFAILMEWAARNGFEHYEISNFAKKGFRSVHNTNYWLNKKYLGLGPSSHSYNGFVRMNNIRNNAQYIKLVNNNDLTYESEELTTTQRINEYLLTNLRTIWGVDLSYFESKFGLEMKYQLIEKLKENSNKDLLEIDNNIIRLSNKGKYFADYITSELFF